MPNSDSDVEEDEDMVYLYRIPLQKVNGVEKLMYDPSSQGETLMYHTGANKVTYIQDQVVAHFHKDSVNVEVEKVRKEDVLESEDLVSDFA